jgi:hypothetical protein
LATAAAEVRSNIMQFAWEPMNIHMSDREMSIAQNISRKTQQAVKSFWSQARCSGL